MTEQTKICGGCNQLLPLTCFSPRSGCSTPCWVSHCRQCRNAKMRKTRIYTYVRKPIDVRENNAFNLWHGPVSREQMLRCLP